jgi:hypothetical protein
MKVERYVPPGFRHFTLERVDGKGPAVIVKTGTAQVGSDPMNDVVVDEPTVARFHSARWPCASRCRAR